MYATIIMATKTSMVILKERMINKIKEEIPFVDIKPYSHNLIGLELELLAETFGQAEANKVIRETPLKDLGWGWVLGEEEKKE